MAPGASYTHMTDQILAAGNRAVSPPALGPNRGGLSQLQEVHRLLTEVL